MWSRADCDFMRRALKLARRGRYTVSPNPCVGCVIVRDGRIIGEGWHQRCGQAHAEVNAVQDAHGEVAGATVYVTLEPCSHHGRTPPCAAMLAEHGVAEVVAAMEDPNPLVSGRGLTLLRERGIRVRTGLMSEAAQRLNRAFFKAVTQQLPYVRVKLGMSLDARVALADGRSQWITNARSRARVQQLRAGSDAIISSADTVLADNPALTVRYAELPSRVRRRWSGHELRQPLRVIIDSRGRLAGRTAEFRVFARGPSLLVTADGSGAQAAAGTQWLELPEDRGHADLRALLRELARRQVRSVLVEAGPRLAGAFIDQGLCDELVCFVAPRLLGRGGLAAFVTAPLADLSLPPALRLTRVRRLQDDVWLRYEACGPMPEPGPAAAPGA